MCMAYVHYYPKIALADCKTQPEFHSFLSALGVTKVRGKILQEMNMPYKPELVNILIRMYEMKQISNNILRI